MRKQFIMRVFIAGLSLAVIAWSFEVKAASLPEVVEAAKKEGTVSAKLFSGLTPKSIDRLAKEIRARFGVDLKIKFTPSSSMPQDLSESIMEHKLGAAPSYDVMNFGSEHIIPGSRIGVFEKVNWSSLLPKESSPDVIVRLPLYGEVGVSYYSSFNGLMYNPEKIPASQVPKTLAALADPKWKGKVGIHNYYDTWASRAFLSGKENVLPHLRAILKNGAIQGRYADLTNRYLLNEVPMAFSASAFYKNVQDKGMPVAWQNLDQVDERVRALVVRKGSPHPNAAVLLSIYLTTPQGAKLMLEESGAGNAFYPGNYTYDIRTRGKEEGMEIIPHEKMNSLMEFYETEEFANWVKEIKLIFDSAGQR